MLNCYAVCRIATEIVQNLRYDGIRKEVEGMRKHIFALISCLLVFSMLAGCGAEKTPVTEADPIQEETTEATENSELVEEPEVIDEVEEPTELDPNEVVVNTKFGNLYYQEQWENFMQVMISEDDVYTTVAFAGEINGVQYSLFQLNIGDAEDEPSAWITDAHGEKHGVYVTMEEIGMIPELTEGEQNRLFAMQEEINFILENIE